MHGISIALATHNGEKYLAAQLDSIARQTKLPAELVITDDCSDDRTLEIASEFAARAPFPVRIICGERRLGFSDNFMRAAQLCEADLIAFCDQDDIWEADKLAVMERPFADPAVMLAYHNATLISASNKPHGRLYGGSSGMLTFKPLTRHPWLVVPGFAQVFRRKLTQFSRLHPASRDLDWPDKPLPHDRWFVLIASVLGSMVFIRRPLARYRQHGANAFGAYPDRRARYDHLIGAERFIRAAAAAARNRSETLDRLQEMLAAPDRERAQQGATFYELLRRRLDERTAIYAAPSYSARLKALYRLFSSGGYSRAFGSARFTGLDLLMDLYIGTPLGPRLRKLLR